MDGFKQILFPVDLSGTSPKIVPFVRKVAEKFDATIHVVYVVENLEGFAGFYVPHPSIETFSGELKKGATRKLSEFYYEYFADLKKVKYEIILGDPAEEIVRYARENAMDLIVMGTHGRKGIDRLLFGSVAEKVVKMSSVPVMTVNPHRLEE